MTALPDPAAMTLRDKAAQLFVLQVHGTRADTRDPDAAARNRRMYGVDSAEQLIERHRPGGVVYFRDDPANITGPRQVAALSNGLQRAALAQPHAVPLTIAVDQEGGPVARLPPPFTQTPGAMALAAARDPATARALAYELARATARELRALGITHNYAPCADLNTDPANPVIGVRSFGADPALAAALTAAQITGHRDGGAAATAKHFPGHGGTAVDSHTGLPVLTRTRAEWERLDLPPFRAAIAAGAEAVMTGHLAVPALDPSGDPATLSRPVVTGLLRDRLRFRGLIVTDALTMAGVRARHGDERVAVLALKAGADVLLAPPPGAFTAQLDAVVAAVRSGELPERRLEESVRRVLELKRRRGLFTDPYVDESRAEHLLGAPGHRAAAQRAADHAVTLLADRDRLLPLRPAPRTVLVTGWGEATTRALADEIARRGPAVTVRPTGADPTGDAAARAAGAARGHDLAVAVTHRAWPPGPRTGPGQAALVKALAATGRPVAVLAVGTPYDLAAFPEARTCLATYSHTPEALRAAAKALFGEITPTGRPPVPVPTR
ncbi:glycoside hydrolase family 3 protein [Spirillospora sp. NPDC050679]